MRKPEQRVYDTMKKNRPPGMRLERVENLLDQGMPDVHGFMNGKTCWFELKHAERPVRPMTPLLKKDQVRRDQVSWHLSYASEGGRSFVLVRDSRLQLYLIPGVLANIAHTIALCDCVMLYRMNSWQQLFEEAFQ